MVPLHTGVCAKDKRQKIPRTEKAERQKGREVFLGFLGFFLGFFLRSFWGSFGIYLVCLGFFLADRQKGRKAGRQNGRMAERYLGEMPVLEVQQPLPPTSSPCCFLLALS